MVKSGFGAVNQLLWSLFFYVQRPKAAENTGVLFAFPKKYVFTNIDA